MEVDSVRETMEPGCETCIYREDCPDAQWSTFCTEWRSKVPEPVGEDPNARWRRGDGPWP